MSDSYSIRRDLLAMSKDILMLEWQAKVKGIEDTYRQATARSTLTINYPDIPPAPTADTIIKMASELNLWVSATSPSHYRQMKEKEQNQQKGSDKDSLSPFGLSGTHKVSTDTIRQLTEKPRYLLTVKANSSSSIAPGKWEIPADTQEEAMKIAYNWCESTRQAAGAEVRHQAPKWYINPDTFDAHWNHDNIFFMIRELR